MECCPFHPPGDLRGNSYTPCDRGHQRRTVFLVDAKKLLLEGFGEEEEGVGRVEAQGVVGICLSEPLYCISQLQILNT